MLRLAVGLLVALVLGSMQQVGAVGGVDVYLNATADCFVDDSQPTFSNGQGDSICTGWAGASAFQAALLKFDVSAVPANAQIVSAWLSLSIAHRSANANGTALIAYALVDDWTEPAAFADACDLVDTVGNETSFTYPWATFSGAFTSVNASTAEIVTDAAVDVIFAVDGLVRSWHAGTANFGFAILSLSDTANSSISFHSRQSAMVNLRPLLQIVYVDPNPTPSSSPPASPTLGPSFSAAPTPAASSSAPSPSCQPLKKEYNVAVAFDVAVGSTLSEDVLNRAILDAADRASIDIDRIWVKNVAANPAGTQLELTLWVLDSVCGAGDAREGAKALAAQMKSAETKDALGAACTPDPCKITKVVFYADKQKSPASTVAASVALVALSVALLLL